ncbi:integrase core domain-containing protein [Octadecabacter antarcticus]|uniref:integrase core domain-containing protein n=1 Tax=Octadecabacter antarcticus TaxID=1217908 RepID=UPI0002F0F268
MGSGHRLRLALYCASPPLGDACIACWVIDECLNETLFGTLHNARETLDEWQEGYNCRRPHSALGSGSHATMSD